MIDSCLERNRKAIILDKVMVNADTTSQYLAVVPEDIKAYAATHFQTIAGSTNKIVTDQSSHNFNPNWNEWQCYYEPL
ncbi:4560_t:CDS:2 [Funneliformis geosporum]|nr:4560_t:CDS:2 [Funneliformis geosporum]